MDKGDKETGALRVVDNFPADMPVSPSELDAVEAFLMPLVHALLSDSEAPQCSASVRSGRLRG
jgi:hypothetical protein